MAATLLKSAAFVFALLPVAAWSQDHIRHDNVAPYAGFQDREIKSLSEQDVAELRRGGGWGLALPAELNGRPGPLHLLQLKDELGLTAQQADAISVIFEEMNAAAIAAGERFILAEAAISKAFLDPELTEEKLRDLLALASQARAELRLVHLSSHLITPDLLSEAQMKKYNALRGYEHDPCSNVPTGHDAKMWRRHNGCE